MNALVFEAPGTLVWKEVPSPVLPEPYGVILHPVAVAPCTSDIHTVFGGSKPKTGNHILGHECIARVEQTASLVTDFRVGDLVAVPAITPNWRALAIQEGNYGHAEEHFAANRLGRTWPGVFADYFALPDADTTLAHIPVEITPEQSLMAVDVMTTGITGAENADIHFGDTVCVIGVGPIGLMAVAGAAHLGAGRIIAVGSRRKCTELAYHYGATDVIDYRNGNIADQVLEMTNGIGADSVIIAGGNDEVFSQAVDMVRYGIGTISNVNYFGGNGSLQFPKFSGGRGMAGKTIHTELCKGGRARIERMLKLIEYGRIDPAPLVTHKLYGWENLEKAILLMRDKSQDLVKVMVCTE